jgi:hypothetical protein
LLEPVLDEVAGILNQKARPALLIGLRLVNRPPAALQADPQAVRSQLLSVTQDLEDARSSLDRIASGNERFRQELADIVGDTTILEGLISELRDFGATLGSVDAASLQRSNGVLQRQRAPALYWIDGCNQRINDLRTAAASAKPGSGA